MKRFLRQRYPYRLLTERKWVKHKIAAYQTTRAPWNLFLSARFAVKSSVFNQMYFTDTIA